MSASPHPLDALRRLSRVPGIADAAVLGYAVDEIDRLTEALAAAVEERDENAAEVDAMIAGTPSPLVALASQLLCAPAGHMLAVLYPSGGVDTESTARRAIDLARCILRAT